MALQYYRNKVTISNIEPGALWVSPDGETISLMDDDQSVVTLLDNRFQKEPL